MRIDVISKFGDQVQTSVFGVCRMMDIRHESFARVLCGAPELSIVVPTYNESENVAPLLQKLCDALEGVEFEVIYVDDDSPDKTWLRVREIAASATRVRCIRRVGRRGLAGACIEGILSSSAQFVAVIDGDLQHDESLLPKMLDMLRGNECDLALGSRYISGGSAESFSRVRASVSRYANLIASAALGIRVNDPVSGFFMMRRDKFEELAPSLSPYGFKILLDILASARGSLRTAELPYRFRDRQSGESKISAIVALDFAGLIIAKLSREKISPRFVLFASIGAIGLIVHFVSLYIGEGVFSAAFSKAQVAASFVAMISNFLLNNAVTYRDQKLRGKDFWIGLIVFCGLCSVGVLANVGVAFALYGNDSRWWIAGLAGGLVGTIWNYAMSSVFVWRVR